MMQRVQWIRSFRRTPALFFLAGVCAVPSVVQLVLIASARYLGAADAGPNGPVSAITAAGTNVYVGGRFTVEGTMPITNIAQWNGTTWSALGGGLRGDRVRSLAISPDGVYAGVGATNTDGTGQSYIAKWDGTNWSTVGVIGDGSALALAYREPYLYAAGTFTNVGNIPAKWVAQWDGRQWSAMGEGLLGPGLSLATSGERVFVAQATFPSGGAISRWEHGQWTLVRSASGENFAALTATERDLFVGGTFRFDNLLSLAKWDGTNWLPPTLDTGFLHCDLPPTPCDIVRALTMNGTDLFVGGHSLHTPPLASSGELFRVDASNRWTRVSAGGGTVRALACNGSDLFAGRLESPYFTVYPIRYALEASRSNEVLTLSWPATGSNYLVEAALSLNSGDWIALPHVPTFRGPRLAVTTDISAPRQFFRLRRRY